MGRVIADEDILNATLAVVAREGYAGATTRQIAAEAGINEVTLFRRFGSKKNLLMAAIAHEAATYRAEDVGYTGDLEADLSRLVDFYGSLMRRRGHVIIMLAAEGQRQPELLDVLRDPVVVFERARRVLERYQKDGVLVAESPGEAFAALVGPLFLDTVLALIVPETPAGQPDTARLVALFLDGRRA